MTRTACAFCGYSPRIDYAKIPPLIQAGIDRYVNDGRPPGDFLTAVICNNLKEAVGRADQDSLAALHSIVAYFYNMVPSVCWGTKERMRDWMEAKHNQERDRSR
jgi:hypothetical protein